MKCPANDNGTCQLVIALGERCDGHSRKCKMRPVVEAQHEVRMKALSCMRAAFGIRGDA